MTAQGAARAAGRREDVAKTVRLARAYGATWEEVSAALGVHHGTASGALSFLHRDGDLARLAGVTRNGCKVYVHPGYLYDRPTEPHGRYREPTEAQIEAFRKAWHEADAAGQHGDRVRAGLLAALNVR